MSEAEYYAAMMEGGDLAAHDELDAAEQAYRRAVTLAEALDGGEGALSGEARLCHATCRAEQNAYEEALSGLERAVAILAAQATPDKGLLGRAYMSRSAVRAALDQLDGAMSDAREAIQLLGAAGPEHAGLMSSTQQMLHDIEAEASARN